MEPVGTKQYFLLQKAKIERLNGFVEAKDPDEISLRVIYEVAVVLFQEIVKVFAGDNFYLNRIQSAYEDLNQRMVESSYNKNVIALVDSIDEKHPLKQIAHQWQIQLLSERKALVHVADEIDASPSMDDEYMQIMRAIREVKKVLVLQDKRTSEAVLLQSLTNFTIETIQEGVKKAKRDLNEWHEAYFKGIDKVLEEAKAELIEAKQQFDDEKESEEAKINLQQAKENLAFLERQKSLVQISENVLLQNLPERLNQLGATSVINSANECSMIGLKEIAALFAQDAEEVRFIMKFSQHYRDFAVLYDALQEAEGPFDEEKDQLLKGKIKTLEDLRKEADFKPFLLDPRKTFLLNEMIATLKQVVDPKSLTRRRF